MARTTESSALRTEQGANNKGESPAMAALRARLKRAEIARRDYDRLKALEAGYRNDRLTTPDTTTAEPIDAHAVSSMAAHRQPEIERAENGAAQHGHAPGSQFNPNEAEASNAAMDEFDRNIRKITMEQTAKLDAYKQAETSKFSEDPRSIDTALASRHPLPDYQRGLAEASPATAASLHPAVQHAQPQPPAGPRPTASEEPRASAAQQQLQQRRVRRDLSAPTASSAARGKEQEAKRAVADRQMAVIKEHQAKLVDAKQKQQQQLRANLQQQPATSRQTGRRAAPDVPESKPKLAVHAHVRHEREQPSCHMAQLDVEELATAHPHPDQLANAEADVPEEHGLTIRSELQEEVAEEIFAQSVGATKGDL